MLDLLGDTEEIPIPILRHRTQTPEGVPAMYTNLDDTSHRESVASYVRGCLVSEKRFEGLDGYNLPRKLNGKTVKYLFNLPRTYFPDVENSACRGKSEKLFHPSCSSVLILTIVIIIT